MTRILPRRQCDIQNRDRKGAELRTARKTALRRGGSRLGSENRSLTVAVRIGRAPAAFTLVELLVVITIIGILVSILVPAIGAVRKAARNMATGAALTSIGTGLETFKANAQLGGLYPQSRSDYTDAEFGSLVTSPYTNATSPNLAITGAGLLVWALSGADLLGTAGFMATNDRTYWGQSTGKLCNADPTRGDLYALYDLCDATRSGQPQQPRYGAYVDTSKLRVTRNEAPASLDSPGFVIPDEYKYANGQTRLYPMYLDAFGYPILYWRADTAGRQWVDLAPNSAAPASRGVYHFGENRALVESLGNAEPPLVLNKAREAHKLAWGPGSYDVASPPPLGTFQRYIMDMNVQAKVWPQRADSYLLVSPGFDGRYGTADDVTNFQHNGL